MTKPPRRGYMVRAWMTVRINNMGNGFCSISCCITTASTSEVYTFRSAKHRLVAAPKRDKKKKKKKKCHLLCRVPKPPLFVPVRVVPLMMDFMSHLEESMLCRAMSSSPGFSGDTAEAPSPARGQYRVALFLGQSGWGWGSGGRAGGPSRGGARGEGLSLGSPCAPAALPREMPCSIVPPQHWPVCPEKALGLPPWLSHGVPPQGGPMSHLQKVPCPHSRHWDGPQACLMVSHTREVPCPTSRRSHVPTASTGTVPRDAPWCPIPWRSHVPTVSTGTAPRDIPRCSTMGTSHVPPQ